MQQSIEVIIGAVALRDTFVAQDFANSSQSLGPESGLVCPECKVRGRRRIRPGAGRDAGPRLRQCAATRFASKLSKLFANCPASLSGRFVVFGARREDIPV